MNRNNALIIGDKDYLSKIIETYLSQDFKCISVRTGSEAADVLEKNDVSVAVISLSADGENGETLMNCVKSRKDIPVVILTDNASSLVRIKYLKAGAADVMTKPFNPEELQLRVARLA